MNALLWTITTTCRWTQVYYWRTFCLFKELFYYYTSTKSRWWKEMGHGQHTTYFLCISSLKESVSCNRLFNASKQISILRNLRLWDGFKITFLIESNTCKLMVLPKTKGLSVMEYHKKKATTDESPMDVSLCRRHWSASVCLRSGGTCKWRSTEFRLVASSNKLILNARSVSWWW